MAMAAPPRGIFSSRTARYIALRAFSAAHRVAMAAPRRVRFAAIYLLLGALWVANASTIAKAFERCAGVDCFYLDDVCRISLSFSAIGVMSLILLRVHCSILSEAREAVAGAHDDLSPEVSVLPCPPVGKMGHLTDLDLVRLLVGFSSPCATIGLVGLVYQVFSPVMGSPAGLFGNILAKVGCLGTAYAYCILVIPCIILRLRMFHMEKDKGATAA